MVRKIKGEIEEAVVKEKKDGKRDEGSAERKIERGYHKDDFQALAESVGGGLRFW